MAVTDKSIEVNAPVEITYNQWTQFEDFPRFMEGVKEVTQLSDTMVHWKANVAGKDQEWDAEIMQQVPDRRIAWRSLKGVKISGAIDFEPIGTESTLVTAHMEYEPDSIIEKAGDKLGVVGKRVEGDLKRFKGFLEARGSETGAWRGSVSG